MQAKFTTNFRAKGLFEASALCPLVSEKSNVFVCDNPDVANLVMKLLKAIVWLYPVNASVITAWILHGKF